MLSWYSIATGGGSILAFCQICVRSCQICAFSLPNLCFFSEKGVFNRCDCIPPLDLFTLLWYSIATGGGSIRKKGFLFATGGGSILALCQICVRSCQICVSFDKFVSDFAKFVLFLCQICVFSRKKGFLIDATAYQL